MIRTCCPFYVSGILAAYHICRYSTRKSEMTGRDFEDARGREPIHWPVRSCCG